MAKQNDAKLMHGQELDRESNVAIPYTQQIVREPVIPTANAEITPINPLQSLVKTIAVPTSAFDSYHLEYPSRASLYIPARLDGIAVVWNEGYGEGDTDSDFDGIASGTSYSLNGSENSSARSSASLVPSLRITITEFPQQRWPTTTHVYLMSNTGINTTAILAKIGGGATVWPVFKPRAEQIIAMGMKVSVDAQTQCNAGRTYVEDRTDSWDQTVGGGTGVDVSTVNDVVTIPPTVHGEITISGDTTKSRKVEAISSVGWIGFGGFPTISKTTEKDMTAAGSVTPTTLTATSPSAIPTSGLYLVDVDVRMWKYGYSMVFATVLDASIFA